MGKHKKTLQLVEAAYEVMAAHHPMTVRQVIENNRSQYQAVSNALVDARKDGTIPWTWIEDRLRRPRCVSMWDDLTDFVEDMQGYYRRDVWAEQPIYLEAWLEKDALSGIFEDVLKPYGVTLNVGRGYDGWDSIHNAAERYENSEEEVVLYFGDFDPSGEDMVRSLQKRLAELGSKPEIVKCALTLEDMTRYNLPADFTKATDTRRRAFVEKYGDMAVELDALPVDGLRARLVSEVEARMDMEALAHVRQVEQQERTRLIELLKKAA